MGDSPGFFEHPTLRGLDPSTFLEHPLPPMLDPSSHQVVAMTKLQKKGRRVKENFLPLKHWPPQKKTIPGENPATGMNYFEYIDHNFN